MKLSKVIQSLLLVISLFSFSVSAIATSFNYLNFKSEQMDELVGVWSRDIENSDQSMVMEFKRNGSVEIIVYNRFNIKSFDMAIGKYLIKDNKLYTVFYDAQGSKKFFKLNQIIESDLISVDNDELVIKDNNAKSDSKSQTKVYKIMSRRSFKKQDMI